MRNKFFFSTFIGILALLGISLDTTSVANQELIIQFSDSESPESNSQNALALITRELESIAVDHLKIEKLVNGSLKVSYYSNIDAGVIKQQLSDAIGSNFEDTAYTSKQGNDKLPFEKNTDTYSIDIYKTQDINDLDGAATDIVEPKLETTRSSDFKTYLFINRNKEQAKRIIEQVAYNIQRHTILTIDATSYEIPEVRAGPRASLS